MERDQHKAPRAAAAPIDMRVVSDMAVGCCEGSLFYGGDAALHVRTRDEALVGSPTRAIWMPSGTAYRLISERPEEVERIGLRRAFEPGLPSRPQAVVVTPLMREIIAAMASRCSTGRADERSERLMAVLLDQLVPAEQPSLKLRLGRDARLRRVTVPLAQNPQDETPLDGWARRAGASVRTLARLFAAETGLTFINWRQKARITRSIGLLASGRSVAEAAHSVGYVNPNAFIAAFKKFAGTTPARFFDA